MDKLYKKRIPFTQICNNVICSNVLSVKAKAVFCYLSSRPDDWVFHRNEIKSNFKESMNTIVSAIDELENIGILQRKRMRREDGTMGGTFFYLDTDFDFNSTRTQNTNAGETNAGETNAGFLTPNNTNKNNTEKTNTDNKVNNNKGELFNFEKHVNDMWYAEAKRIQPTWEDPLIQETMENFKDHWDSATGANARKRNWLATWRKWLRSPYNKPQQQKTYNNTKLSASQMDWDKI